MLVFVFVFVLSQEYRPRTFWFNMADAAFQSLVCFFIPYLVSWHLAQSFSAASSSDPQTQDATVFQAYYDSDTDVFTWGTPITAIALFTFLLHLGIETKTWVRAVGMIPRGADAVGPTIPGRFHDIQKISEQTGDCKASFTVEKGNKYMGPPHVLEALMWELLHPDQ